MASTREERRECRGEVIIRHLIERTSLESPEINHLAFTLNKAIVDYEDSLSSVSKSKGG